MDKKVYIIVGHYGSGKSEFSINFAQKLIEGKDNVTIADLDIVNPYFRSREAREKLAQLGIKVIGDTLNSTKGLDMPYLSPAIQGEIVHHNSNVILDCGGDDVGIRVLKQFTSQIRNRDYEVLMIINTYRPQTSNVNQILAMKTKLEKEAGLSVSGFINNSNFLRHTTIEDMVASDKIMKEVSGITEIPIKYVSGMKEVINKLPEEISGERLVLDLSLRSEWL